jgi:hypothetical protein
MTQELMAEFSAAAGLGNLSAFYLYGYVATQTDRLMVDRYGAAR